MKILAFFIYKDNYVSSCLFNIVLYLYNKLYILYGTKNVSNK